ncbi:uncharacterized protein METZ01_LOCUS442592, partial [marine metagenome]
SSRYWVPNKALAIQTIVGKSLGSFAGETLLRKNKE